jgi:hypothetical protein
MLAMQRETRSFLATSPLHSSGMSKLNRYGGSSPKACLSSHSHRSPSHATSTKPSPGAAFPGIAMHSALNQQLAVSPPSELRAPLPPPACNTQCRNRGGSPAALASLSSALLRVSLASVTVSGGDDVGGGVDTLGGDATGAVLSAQADCHAEPPKQADTKSHARAVMIILSDL